MSWKDEIQELVFTIITGDGKEWFPKWKNAMKDVDFNSTIFEFINVEGSLVLREKPKGRKFELEFYFDGENAVNNGNAFELSSRDNRAWTIKHPFYGDIKCQPLSLKQDNTILNVSKFIVPVIETITKNYPIPVPIFEDEIISKHETTNDNQAIAFDSADDIDRVELTSTVNYLDDTYSKIFNSGDDLTEFKILVTDALTEINNVESTGLSILRSIQAIINYPANIEQTVAARFVILKESFDGLKESFDGDNHLFESVAGGIIAAMFIASSTNITDDYEIRNDVINHQDNLTDEYNDYLAFLDELQTDRADSDDSYIPEFNSLNSINELSGLTIANLFNISFSAKQERQYTLDKDSNAILLTHKFYGLDDDDENLTKFIDTNNIGLIELFNIIKGRKILYYV